MPRLFKDWIMCNWHNQNTKSWKWIGNFSFLFSAKTLMVSRLSKVNCTWSGSKWQLSLICVAINPVFFEAIKSSCKLKLLWNNFSFATETVNWANQHFTWEIWDMLATHYSFLVTRVTNEIKGVSRLLCRF